MSKKLERSRDEEIEREKRISRLEEGDKNNRMNNFHKNNKNEELLESESDEYIEEEDEEDGEIDDDEDETSKEFQKTKKRKLEQKPIWSRKKSDAMVLESEDTLSNADIVINNPEKKDTQKKEKFISLNNDSKNQNDSSKKINFFTKPNDVSIEGLNNQKKTDHKAPSNYFSVNNDSKDNKNFIILNNQNNNNEKLNNLNNSNNEQNIIFNDNTVKNIKMINPNNNTTINNNISNSNNESKTNFLQPENKFTSEVKKMHISSPMHQIPNQPQPNRIKINVPEMFNCFRLNKITKDIFVKYNFKSLPPNFETILFFLQDKLKIYLKIYITRLISISRIRNVNFNLYSNNPNGQTHYKFKTYNWEISNNNVTFSPAKIFDILFTSNYKKKFDLIEEYVELNNKKTKFEKLSSCKEKYEESNKTKGIESSIKITDGPNPTIKLLPGRRTKKKNNTFFKEMRKKIVQSKKKEDLKLQKSNTKNTLDAILNDNINSSTNYPSLSNLIDGNSTNLLDVSSKMSDTNSYHNLSNTNNYINNTINNEISMNVFTYFDPTKDGKIPGRQKKKINLKDFIFLLENSTEFIPNKILLLNKAAVDNTNNK